MAKKVRWVGDTLEVVRGFSPSARQDIGHAIRALLDGQNPGCTRHMPGLPKKVWEIRTQDKDSWYRVAYVTFVKGEVVFLYAFKKKSNSTSKLDLNNIASRLKEV